MSSYTMTHVGFGTVQALGAGTLIVDLPADPASVFVLVLTLLCIGAVVRFGRR